jgi:hypothetical protein
MRVRGDSRTALSARGASAGAARVTAALAGASAGCPGLAASGRCRGSTGTPASRRTSSSGDPRGFSAGASALFLRVSAAPGNASGDACLASGGAEGTLAPIRSAAAISFRDSISGSGVSARGGRAISGASSRITVTKLTLNKITAAIDSGTRQEWLNGEPAGLGRAPTSVRAAARTAASSAADGSSRAAAR